MLYDISNIQALESFSQKLIDKLRLPCVFLLEGELGAGKTTFVHCFCKKLNVKDQVNSPGFNLMNLYISNCIKWGEIIIYHYDFYRLKQAVNPNITELLEEVRASRVIELSQEDNYICFIEWPNAVDFHWESFWETRDVKTLKLLFTYKDNEQERSIQYV